MLDEYEPPILETTLVVFPVLLSILYSVSICSSPQAEQMALHFLVAPQGIIAQQAQIIVRIKIMAQIMPRNVVWIHLKGLKDSLLFTPTLAQAAKKVAHGLNHRGIDAACLALLVRLNFARQTNDGMIYAIQNI